MSMMSTGTVKILSVMQKDLATSFTINFSSDPKFSNSQILEWLATGTFLQNHQRHKSANSHYQESIGVR